MVKLSGEFIFRLKSICDITSVISNYVELKLSGRNKKCCCPFHSEKTPSFFVFEETSSFYCFGCGIGGDVITFVEKMENLEYVEAVKFLCKMAGLEFPDNENLTDEKTKLKSKVLEINREAARFFFDNLKREEGKKALSYFVKKRGLKRKTIVKFGLGYSLKSWTSLKDHLVKKGYSLEEIASSDLILKSKKGGFYDKFRGRIMFPIIDLKGDVVAFGARRLEEEDFPKYLNSADTVVFKKSTILYGLNYAKNSRIENFLLCEGYLDVLMLHQNGIDSAVATLGTALTGEQARLLKRNNKEIILAYDMDSAGKVASKRASLLFEEIGLRAKVLNFQKAKDPDEYIKKFGVDSFKKVIDKAVTYDKYQFDSLERKYNLENIDEKRKYIEEFCNIIAREKDSLKREIEIGQICQKLSLEKFVVAAHVKYLINKRKKYGKKNLEKNFFIERTRKRRENKGLPQKVVRAQEGVLRFLYYNPDKVNYVSKEIDESYFIEEWHKKIYCFLLQSISNKKNLDFSSFRFILNEKDLGEFSRIINYKIFFANTLEELKEYLKILKEFREEKKIDFKNMSIEDMEEYFQKKAELKR